MNHLPRVAPPADGLRLAMSAARHRRLRTAGTTTSLTAAALSVTVLALGTPGTQTLLQNPAPERPAVTTILQDEDAPTPAARADAPHLLSAPAGTAPLAGPPASAVLPAAPAGAQASGALRPGKASRPYAAGPLTKRENVITLPSCAVSASTQDTMSLCPSTTVTSYASYTELYAEVCSTRTNATTLHYPGRNEVDFAITRQGETLWRWSAWHPDGGTSHTQLLETGACNRWTFDWTLVDARGKRLPKGSYTLRTTFLAEELGGPKVLGTTFTIS